MPSLSASLMKTCSAEKSSCSDTIAATALPDSLPIIPNPPLPPSARLRERARLLRLLTRERREQSSSSSSRQSQAVRPVSSRFGFHECDAALLSSSPFHPTRAPGGVRGARRRARTAAQVARVAS